MKNYYITALFCAALLCGLAGYSKSSEKQDSESRNQVEEANALTSPDLAFFNLHGNVESVIYTCEYSIPMLTDDPSPIKFDREGNCINIKEALYLPEVAKEIDLTRNEKGEVVKAVFKNPYPSADSPGNYEFSWNNGQLFRITYEAWEYNEEYSISYDNGLVSNMIFSYHSDGDNGETVINLSNFKFDDKGNWIECTGAFTSTTWDNYFEGDEPNKETEPTVNIPITRKLTYY